MIIYDYPWHARAKHIWRGVMNAYPRLSEKAYADDKAHREEVIERIVEESAEIWRYYTGDSLNPSGLIDLKTVLKEALPE